MPRAAGAQCVKKDQMTERLKRLSTSQKLLSPEQIPSGAVRIFPDVTSETTTRREVYAAAEEAHHHHRVKNETIGSRAATPSEQPPTPAHHRAAAPLLRPRADIEVRPGSPRPSAEAISMEKLWSKPSVPHSQTRTYGSSESQSFVSEYAERNGEPVKNESREEKSGSVIVDDGVEKVSQSFSEISVRPAIATKHVEPPPRHEADNKRPAASVNAQFNGNATIRTQRFSGESSQARTSSQLFSPEPRSPILGLVKHVEPPSGTAHQFARSHSEETAARQWRPQPGPDDNTRSSSSFESHHRSVFTRDVEMDGVSVASERREEVGGRTVDGGGVRNAYDSFSERSKSQPPVRGHSSNKSNSIKTMQKMFEQTGGGSGGGGGGGSPFAAGNNSAARPYGRTRFGTSDSDFESEAELSKYCGAEQQQQNVFESKVYTSKTQLQEIKSTSTVVLQSPVKESGYAADTDEPRGLQSDASHHHHHHHHQNHQATFGSKRSNNPGFQSAFIKKVRRARIFTILLN